MKSNRLQMTVKTTRDIERFADTIRALTFAGMSLEIQQSGDEAYIDIEPREAKAAAEVSASVSMELPSKSERGYYHTVVINDMGSAACPCDGFKWRGTCSHAMEAESLYRHYGIKCVIGSV